jgi:hypothetical protein
MNKPGSLKELKSTAETRTGSPRAKKERADGIFIIVLGIVKWVQKLLKGMLN